VEMECTLIIAEKSSKEHFTMILLCMEDKLMKKEKFIQAISKILKNMVKEYCYCKMELSNMVLGIMISYKPHHQTQIILSMMI
jgi:hypothetical protein